MKKLLAAVSVMSILACHKGVDRIEVPADPTLQTKFVSTCDQKTNSFRAKPNLTEEETVKVTIERKFQRVVRKDCNGNVTGSKLETVQSPRLDLDLKPQRQLSRPASDVRLFDSETCEDSTQELPISWGIFNKITGSKDGAIRVKLDLADAAFTFKVTTGLNHIYYTYSDSEEITSGVFNVHIDYVETTIAGESVVPAGNCTTK